LARAVALVGDFALPAFRHNAQGSPTNDFATEGSSYARFFSRLRAEISAISMGPMVNSPAAALRVSSRK